MKISDIISHKKANKENIFSFEFFPPKSDDGVIHLLNTAVKLHDLKPSFISITYGAGGSTRKKTRDLSLKIQNQVGIETMAHLTSVGSSRDEIYEIVKSYRDSGVENILALRGDPPKGQDHFVAADNGFTHANEIVEFIKDKFGDYFSLGVAGYPEKHVQAAGMEEDLLNLKRKVDAGAAFIITQLFLDNSFFFRFLDELNKRAIEVPVLAGIMPITDFNQIKKFTEMIGASIPAQLVSKLEKASASGDGEEVKKTGLDWAIKQCHELLEQGVDGIHFYTLNKSLPTLQIFNSLPK